MREHAENPAGTGTALTAMLFSGGRAAPAHRRSRAFRLRDGQLRRIATSSPLACSPMLARHADGRPDRSADVGLRIGGRYLLCADGPGPLMDDRTHFFVLTLRAISADALANWAS